ncbi:MAG: hypothetical protein AB7H93_12190 [Vicinamibacterales bacterium]
MSRGLPVYLDHCAMVQLAKGNAHRRKRFLRVLDAGADLLFSVGNGWEMAGPLGSTADALRDFLDGVGPNWFPVELDAHAVVGRELQGGVGPEACVSEKFAKDLIRLATRPQGRIVACDSTVFNLGAVFDWMGPQRDELEQAKIEFDEVLVRRIDGYRAKHERDATWLDGAFPDFGFFNPRMPCTFTYMHVVRTLVREAKAYRLKKGDAADFSHAVIGSSFARAVVLDKHWKRRIDGLPKPHNLAKVYAVSELDAFVSDLEVAALRLAERNVKGAA